MHNILRIKEILSDKGLTMNELADNIGVHRVTLSKEINNNPKLDTLLAISKSLNVKIDELFYHIRAENYVITKNNYNNSMIFKDENIWFQGGLPHFTDGDFHSFLLSFEQYNFAISPSVEDVYSFVFETKTITEQIYIGEFKNKKNVRLFNISTYLTASEYTSLETALKLYKNNYQEFYNDNMLKLGAVNFKRIDCSNWFRLCRLTIDDWRRVLKLTKMYDLDSGRTDFECFDARESLITIYNSVDSGYNLKMRLLPINDESDECVVSLAWICPTDYDRNGILTKDIFTAQESYDFLHNILLPKARKLFK